MVTKSNIFQEEIKRVREMVPQSVTGSISQVVGLACECDDFSCPIGSLCLIQGKNIPTPVEAEVIGFRKGRSIIMPFGETRGLGLSDRVKFLQRSQMVPVGDSLLGRILDGSGQVIDDKEPPITSSYRPIYGKAPEPLSRTRIDTELQTGIKAIDAFLTCGKGQRVGIFSGTGVGKSVLLGMIARYTSADVSVVALVGERGREVREFLEKDLGEEGLKKSVVVVATSDEPALLRVKAPFVASAIAEYFRDQGKDVALLMDSITRIAIAQREIGLAAGEPPTTKGFPPSVFGMFPRLLERSGKNERGSITGFYTVLVEADDINEPVSDAVRGILDGHIWLSRDLASRGQYPAISITESISRVMIEVIDDEQLEASRKIKRLVSLYKQAEELVNIGAYVPGNNPELDTSIKMIPRIYEFLGQKIDESADFDISKKTLMDIFNAAIEYERSIVQSKDEKTKKQKQERINR